jgi:ABC-2 type transport system ATP-binding protein
MNVIEVNDLVKRYGDFTAVNGITFSVKQGEIFGLLGPNGAGKTTTLEIIETLRPKTSGSITVLGYNIDAQPFEIKKRIGVQLQSAGYYPSLTLLALLDLFMGLYNVKGDKKELLRRVGLLDKAKAKYKELSGGQKQRFSICTTLIHQPQIVFLDEPTTGLDPQARRNLWDLIREIKAQGATVVITTHYMDEAESLCERVGIMEAGKIIAMATPDELINDLVEKGHAPQREVKQANLEDVFLHLTGHEWRDE